MKNRTRILLAVALAALAPWPGFAQSATTGTLGGQVLADGAAAVGVTVSAVSPAMQGERTVLTGAGGAYSMPYLPAGDYTVTFSLEGLESQVRTVSIGANRTVQLDVAMSASAVSETITVSATADSISSESQASTTITGDMIEDLPVERNMRQAALLSAGVTTNSAASTTAISIAGAPSYQGLFMVNGVVVNENLRGQPLDLFIEDAIQETTISVSGISAEYGRFAGGVVNTITKSGGNQTRGSLRTVFTNDDWIGRNPRSPERVDKINQRYEGTLGGYILRDRLWYFAAGRRYETENTAALVDVDIPYQQVDEETRPEFKLTAALGGGHRLVASYLAIDRINNGNNFQSRAVDLASLDDRKLPQEFMVANYTGIFGAQLTAEAQYSERKFTFEGSGSDFTDRIRGTWLEDGVEIWRYNSPTFCGVCRDEGRDNENLLGKLTWFAPTESGSHELALGVDRFNDIRTSDNHQSGSGFSMFTTTTLFDAAKTPYPVFDNDGSAIIVYWPIAQESEGTDFITNSAYVNDRWRINDRWTANVGVRYDQNDGTNAAGAKVADDAKLSPRLGLSYDVRGDGDWIVNASYGHYVTALANNLADSTSIAGVPSIFVWQYFGPRFNVDPSQGLLSTHQVLQGVFDWFDSVGGINNTEFLVQATIPGGSTVIQDSLQSPYAEEVQLGLSKGLGHRGAIRVDAIHRRYADFYTSHKDLTTGRIRLPSGALVDRGLLENLDDDDRLERTYTGLLTTFRYRWDRFYLGAAYTLSKLEGNHIGETGNSGPVNSLVTEYPEYKEQRWNSPKGYLTGDQRHVARVWGVATLLDRPRHRLSASFLQSYNSGTPYGAIGSVNPKDQTGRFGKPNPGYASNTAPANVAYFFTARDAFRTDDIVQTDLSLNYSFHWNGFGREVEVFLQPEVLNVFGEEGALVVNTAVQDATNTPGLARFNAFTEQPVEGVHWRKGPNFGKPTSEDSYQTPRTFRFSVGFRF